MASMPSQYVTALPAGVAAAVVPVGQARHPELPAEGDGEYVFAAQVMAKAESTRDKANTTTKMRPAEPRALKDFFMTTYRI